MDDKAFFARMLRGADIVADWLTPWFEFWTAQAIDQPEIDDSSAFRHFIIQGLKDLNLRLGRTDRIKQRDILDALLKPTFTSVNLWLDLTERSVSNECVTSQFHLLHDSSVHRYTGYFVLETRPYLNGGHQIALTSAHGVVHRRPSEVVDDSPADELEVAFAEPGAVQLPDDVARRGWQDLRPSEQEAVIDAYLAALSPPSLEGLGDAPTLTWLHLNAGLELLANQFADGQVLPYTGMDWSDIGGPNNVPPEPWGFEVFGDPELFFCGVLWEQMRRSYDLEFELQDDAPGPLSDEALAAWHSAFSMFEPGTVSLEYSHHNYPEDKDLIGTTIRQHVLVASSQRLVTLAESGQHDALFGDMFDTEEAVDLHAALRTQGLPDVELTVLIWHDELGSVTFRISVDRGSISQTILLPRTTHLWEMYIGSSLATSSFLWPTVASYPNFVHAPAIEERLRLRWGP